MKSLIYTIIAFVFLSYVHGAYAADNGETPFAFSGEKNQPVEITADDSIEWIKEENKYVATGHAIATQGENSVMSDTLTALYNPETGQTDITTLIAQGNVIMTGNTRTVKGDKAVYDVKTGSLTVTGNPVTLETPTQSITATQSLTYYDGEQKAEAVGHVVAKDGTNTLKTDRLIAYFMEENGKRVIGRAETYGHTQIITATEVATGDNGTYNARTQKARLKGNVKITRGENQLNGAEAEVDMKTGFSQIYSAPAEQGAPKQRVRALFMSEDKDTSQK